MTRLLNQFFTISRITFLEVIRQPITVILLLIALGAAAFLPLVISQTLGETQIMVIDSILALQFITGLLLAGFAAGATVSREIHRGTAASILSKPVPGTVFFMAKYAGIASVLALFSFCMAVACIISARTCHEAFRTDWVSASGMLLTLCVCLLAAGTINYARRKPFSSSAFLILAAGLSILFIVLGFFDRSLQWQSAFGSGYRYDIPALSALILMATLITAALSVMLAVKLDLTAAVTVTCIIFLAGLVSDYFIGPLADHNPAARVGYVLIPNMQHFWVTDALRQGLKVPGAYLLSAALYSLSYSTAILSFGALVFKHAELK